MVNDPVLEYIIILKRIDIEIKITINHGIIKSASLADKTIIGENIFFKLFPMFVHFLGVKLCKLNVLHNPSSSQRYDLPHYSFRCNIECKMFTRIYSFNHKISPYVKWSNF